MQSLRRAPSGQQVYSCLRPSTPVIYLPIAEEQHHIHNNYSKTVPVTSPPIPPDMPTTASSEMSEFQYPPPTYQYLPPPLQPLHSTISHPPNYPNAHIDFETGTLPDFEDAANDLPPKYDIEHSKASSETQAVGDQNTITLYKRYYRCIASGWRSLGFSSATAQAESDSNTNTTTYKRSRRSINGFSTAVTGRRKTLGTRWRNFRRSRKGGALLVCLLLSAVLALIIGLAVGLGDDGQTSDSVSAQKVVPSQGQHSVEYRVYYNGIEYVFQDVAKWLRYVGRDIDHVFGDFFSGVF